jgi:hypothetical protein
MKNPWPIVLTVVIVAFIVTMVSFVVWSLGHRQDLVAPDYYEREIRYQEQIERETRTRDLPGEYGLFHEAAAARLRVRIPPAHTPAKGSIELYRPSDAGLDRTITLEVNENGEQAVDLTNLAPGLWRARLRWTYGTNEYYVAYAVVVE